jgi:hypothetical protein
MKNDKTFIAAEEAAARLETAAQRLAEAIARVESRVNSATAALAVLDEPKAAPIAAKQN